MAGERNNLIVWNHNQKYRDSTENVNNLPFYPEQAPPDPRCLSYTHDRDQTKAAVRVSLPRRSLQIQSQEVRFSWRHGIAREDLPDVKLKPEQLPMLRRPAISRRCCCLDRRKASCVRAEL